MVFCWLEKDFPRFICITLFYVYIRKTFCIQEKKSPEVKKNYGCEKSQDFSFISGIYVSGKSRCRNVKFVRKLAGCTMHMKGSTQTPHHIPTSYLGIIKEIFSVMIYNENLNYSLAFCVLFFVDENIHCLWM